MKRTSHMCLAALTLPPLVIHASTWATDDDDLVVIGLTGNNKLIEFESDKPKDSDVIGTLTGFSGGEISLIGIDYRPLNGILYGVGNLGGIYTVDTGNAALTFVSQMSVAPSGSTFGVDFNPTVDRLRIIGDAGQNLRVNVDTGLTLVDSTLTYPGPPPVTATGLVGAAYTNNDADPNTATTLFDLDSALDQIVIQSPANSGQLAPTGKLGVDATASVGLDIYSVIDDGTTVDLVAFAALNVDGKARWYEIDLLTGRAYHIGKFKSSQQVVDVALPLDQDD